MLPVIVMPMHDPDGVMFPHLELITPQLKSFFAQAFVSIPRSTRERQSQHVHRLAAERFFQVVDIQPDMPTGDHFCALYTQAAEFSHPTQVLHLCFSDRVAFALQSHYRDQFIADIQATHNDRTPLIFQRTRAAWQTHPRNYRDLEGMVTRTGEHLFKKSLDFAWCHLAIQAHHLKEALPNIQHHDMSIEAEIVLKFIDIIHTKQVNWLEWEDPFIYSCDPQQLKKERENSALETHKRLAYVIPMLQLLDETDKEQR
jgi:hypothetical protein